MLRSTAAVGAWTRAERMDFQLRAMAHSAVRLARWKLERGVFPTPQLGRGGPLPHQVSTGRIERRASSFGPKLEAGRWRNLRLVAAALHGIELTPQRSFSFWRTVGRLTAARGFVEGAHFEGGCIVPALGGGVCSMSDRLYELALRSDCEVLERHAHTLSVERRRGPAHAIDATVKWPYVDLRFAPRAGRLRISATVERTGIALAFDSDTQLRQEITLRSHREPNRLRGTARFSRTTLVRIRRSQESEEIEWLARDEKRLIEDPRRSCDTCDEVACSRSRRARAIG